MRGCYKWADDASRRQQSLSGPGTRSRPLPRGGDGACAPGVPEQGPEAHALAAVGVPRDRGLAQGDRRLRGARPAGAAGRAAGADLGLPGDRGPGGGRHRAPLRKPQRLLCLPCRPRDAPAGAGLRGLRARGGGRRRQGVRRHRQVARTGRGSRPRAPWSRCGGCAPVARAKGGSRRMEAHSVQDEPPLHEPAGRQATRPRHDHDCSTTIITITTTATRPALAHDADALFSARSLWLTRSGRAILQGVDIDIAEGEILTLIGPNGAGKTTLVRDAARSRDARPGNDPAQAGPRRRLRAAALRGRSRDPAHRRPLRAARAARGGRGDRARAGRRRRRQARRPPALGAVRAASCSG